MISGTRWQNETPPDRARSRSYPLSFGFDEGTGPAERARVEGAVATPAVCRVLVGMILPLLVGAIANPIPAAQAARKKRSSAKRSSANSPRRTFDLVRKRILRRGDRVQRQAPWRTALGLWPSAVGLYVNRARISRWGWEAGDLERRRKGPIAPLARGAVNAAASVEVALEHAYTAVDNARRPEGAQKRSTAALVREKLIEDASASADDT